MRIPVPAMTVEASQRSMAGSETCGRDQKYYSLPDAARALGLSVRVLRRGARLGWFPIYAPGGSRVRVRLVDVEAYIQSTRAVPPTAKASAHAEAVVDAFIAREKDSKTLRDRRGRATPRPQDNPR